ncbi:uncharacterized protein Ldaf1 [Calliphora vicina]|uniref:uncharacterized protein Ldaf1 n=1 Tax=Calliphora vicina TaxID=7373 RepID=UPI00325C13EA
MVLVEDELSASSSEDEGGNDGSHRNANNDGAKQRQQNTNNADGNSNSEDYPEILFKIFIEASKKLCHQIKRTFHLVMVDLGGYQIFDRFAQWCVQHPQMAICLLSAGLVASLPVLLFVAFVLSTVAMTFTGFLVLEGTLLTILTMIMIGLLGAIVIVLLFFALVGVATYFGVAHVYDMYGSTETQRTNLRNVMQRNGQHLNTHPAPTRNSNQNSQDENVIY